MKWKKLLFRKISFFYFISVISLSAFSQTSEQALEYAQWSYNNEKYDEAIETCERVIFFEKKKKIIASAYMLLANSALAENDYDYALENFSKVKEFSIPTDSIAIEAEFGKIICHILLNDPHYAMISLIDLKSEMTEYFQRKKMFYVAVANFKIRDYPSSERNFIELLNNNDTVFVKEIFGQLEKTKNRINPHKAKILSIIIPGAGQLYLGDYKNALKSFLLNAAIIAAGIELAATYTILDSYLFTSNWFFRYYKGGLLKAQMIAENKLTHATNSALNKLMALTEKAGSEIK